MATAKTRATSAGKVKPKAETEAATNYPVIKDRATLAAVEEYVAKQAEKKLIEGRLEELREPILAAMAGAPTASAGSRVLQATVFDDLPATPNRVITKEMIGQVIPGKRGRSGYVQLKIT